MLSHGGRLRIRLTLNHVPGGHYGVEETLHFVRRPGESVAHIVMKLLGYVLYYRPGLQVERSVGWPYKPDVVALGAQGVPVLWIECGSVSPKKLNWLAPRLGADSLVVIKPYPRQLRAYALSARGRIAHPEAVVLCCPDAGFLTRFVAAAADHAEVRFTVPEGADELYAEVNGVVLNTPILRMRVE